MTVGEQIKALRTDRGLTQKQFGALCHINEVQIRKYERGEVTPKMDTIKKIADGIGITPFELVGVEWADMQLGKEGLSELRTGINNLESVEAMFGEKAAELVGHFTGLNDLGQAKALEYVSDLTEQPKYEKQK